VNEEVLPQWGGLLRQKQTNKAQEMEARFSFEMLVIIYQPTRRHLDTATDVKFYISGKYFDKIMCNNTQIMSDNTQIMSDNTQIMNDNTR
jgi:hypothetical protein